MQFTEGDIARTNKYYIFKKMENRNNILQTLLHVSLQSNPVKPG